ncbi:aspartate aminotransferase family protein [Bordetella genomosp. 12]|uniref:Aspartate aminotransferase family protein n=1 Tax=Bordetella genomosp. 12 TaxID=463035 RepID=A0A261VAB4_9BORD|nr:aminotransferase class III-fold pyridoxal phosphate-dependent enzyme [Bordetella genomosp. 12]OZI70915.1 aspartate aminotransferase family protein [Bordetella genomosp. 12]
MTSIASDSDLLARRSVLGPAYRLFYDTPLHLVRGEDVWLFDAAGRRYLDAYNNVPVVGHANPAVVQALARQAGILNTHTRYLHDNVVTYAERLAAMFPAALDTVMLTCTGSEANDLVLRITREATGRRGMIVTRNAYHGVTLALAEMSPSLLPPSDYVRLVDAPSGPQGAAAFAEAVDAAARDLAAAGTPVAALLVDTVFASDGVHTEARDALAAGARAVRAHGGLFIADEVQGGFGRTGSWWAFQRDDLVPDMVSLGKPMGNGHPIAGLVAQGDLLTKFGQRCRYFNTFGGNSVSAAVGMAVLDELQRIDAPAHAARVGEALQQGLLALARRHAVIGEVRGAGLYWGVEMKHAPQAAAVVNGMRRDGVLISASGAQGQALKIRPPLTFQLQHVDTLVSALDRACQALQDNPSSASQD